MEPVIVSVVATGVVKLISAALAKIGQNLLDKSGDKVADAISTVVGEQAGTLFKKVFVKANEKTAAAEALTDIIAEPKNEDAQAALRIQLQKLMQADPQFVQEVHNLLEAAKPAAQAAGVNITVTGSGAAATAGGLAAGQGGAAVSGNVEGGINIGASKLSNSE